jgi:hypothetical protein
MKTCKHINCGASNPDDAIYCRNCGRSLVMYLSGSFNNWTFEEMTFDTVTGKWKSKTVNLVKNNKYHFKFVNTNSWDKGIEWGNGTNGAIQLRDVAKTKSNNISLNDISINILTSGEYHLMFDDKTLKYEMVLEKQAPEPPVPPSDFWEKAGTIIFKIILTIGLGALAIWLLDISGIGKVGGTAIGFAICWGIWQLIWGNDW